MHKIIEDSDIIRAFRSMDPERQEHALLIMAALAEKNPRQLGGLRLVNPVVADELGQRAQDG